MRKTALLTWLTLLMPTAAACTDQHAEDASSYRGPSALRRADATSRKRVSLSVYNGNFGLVREIRTVNLAPGKVELEFSDVASHIQPETVHLYAVDGPPLTVLEQNYRYDLLTAEKLMEKHVGKRVKLHRYNEKTGVEESFDAEILAYNDGQPVYKIGQDITTSWPGRVSFAEVPASLIPKPSLVWLLGSRAAKQTIEVTYVTQGLSWRADYVLTVDAADKAANLQGWVTLNNQAGASFPDAELKLVAGDVQRVRQRFDEEAARDFRTTTLEGKEESGFKQESFFEYHLYTLGRPTTLLEKEQKQVSLLSATGVGIEKKLVFAGDQAHYRSEYGDVSSNQKVGVFLEFENSEKNRMGMPLPKGIVRVYKKDSSGAEQFIGEDNIDHTPRDEVVRIKMGEAFDVVGSKKQVSWKPLRGSCGSETDWEISLRNHKDVAEKVDVVEPIGGDWELVEQSHRHVKKDARTFVFTVSVPSRGETKITYRVRTRWC